MHLPLHNVSTNANQVWIKVHKPKTSLQREKKAKTKSLTICCLTEEGCVTLHKMTVCVGSHFYYVDADKIPLTKLTTRFLGSTWLSLSLFSGFSLADWLTLPLLFMSLTISAYMQGCIFPTSRTWVAHRLDIKILPDCMSSVNSKEWYNKHLLSCSSALSDHLHLDWEK